MQPSLTQKQKYFAATRIYNAIESTFAHWEDVPDLVHDDAFNSYLDAILSTNYRIDFFKESQRYMALFKNAHTEFVDTSIFPAGEISFGIQARLLTGEWVVEKSSCVDIMPGEVITHIDHQTSHDFLAVYDALVSASRAEYRGYALWRRPFFLPNTIKIELSSGAVKCISKGGHRAMPRRPVELGWIGDIPIITIRSFDQQQFEDDALDLIDKHRGSKGIVIDIRGNGGGSTPLKLMKALLNVPYPTWREASPFRLGVDVACEQIDARGPARAGERSRPTLSWNSLLRYPDEDAYDGKIFILHDIGTKSAAEDFLLPFKATGRALLLGETTCGSSGQPYIDNPFSGATFAVGAKRQSFPNGERFEGVGISPDIPITLSRSALSAKTDPVLNELEKLLR